MTMPTERSPIAGHAAYAVPNAAAQAPQRFSALETLYDPGTIEHLQRSGIVAGWRCL